MAKSLFSASWYRVAVLKPRIRRHAIFHRHIYRGQIWHVIEDRTAERFHRFTPATYTLIGLMTGERTVEQIWRASLETLGDYGPSQDDVIRLLAQLHAADLIDTGTSVEADDLFRRYGMIDRQTLMKRLGAPFAMRLPLVNPDRLLDRLVPLVRPLFTVWGFLLWLALVGTGAVHAGLHWPELTEGLAHRVLEPWNLLGLALAYPVLKICHEMGHALAVKVWGGRVQEIGVMFIVFLPVPYVDASASSSFPSKWRRITVDAAGIMVEMLMAAGAAALWLQMEPGPLQSFLFNMAFIGTVSTLLFNGNPLLKFDGYYILADFLEIPNLAQRAQAYLSYLFQHYLLGAKNKVSPVSARGERFWFLLYAPLAAAYRVFLTFSIAWFLAGQYMVVGVLLAAYAVVLMGLAPLGKGLAQIWNDPELKLRRGRLVAVAAGLAALVGTALFVVPLPRTAVATGVSMLPEQSALRAGSDGVVDAVLAAPGARVAAGTPLLRLSDPTVDSEMRVLQAEMASLQARLTAVQFASPVEADVLRDQIASVQGDLDRESARKGDQVLMAPGDGLFLLPGAEDLPGRFLHRGATIGFVEDPQAVIVAVVLDQVGFGEVQGDLRDIAIWPAGRATGPEPARVIRSYPGGTAVLPHPALSVEGGGDIPVDPRYPGEGRTLVNMFQVDLRPEAPSGQAMIPLGRRYAVRFTLPPEPVGYRLWRHGRRLVRDHLGV